MCAKMIQHDFLKGEKAADTIKYDGVATSVLRLSGAPKYVLKDVYNTVWVNMKEDVNSQTNLILVNMSDKVKGMDISGCKEIAGAYSQQDVKVDNAKIMALDNNKAKEVAMYLKNNRANIAS